MKLSAPPPPPPSPEQPEPGQPTPDSTTPAETTPAETTPAAPPKVLAWPSWFPGADFLLAALGIVLAFLVASFMARNSDVWLHLATGQRLLAGEYRPGTDPFSYTAADRAWVNHSLLYDAVSYLLYRADGTGLVLVVVKALVVALAFGLLIAIRRPGYSLWPWAAVAIIAVLAAAPRIILSPLIGSMLFLSVTLFLLFRLPHRPGSWRFPIAIGVTFWLWAMVDAWFFIGPLALALVLVGELVQRQLGLSSGDDGEPLGPLPDVSTLASALAIGVVACMLNPHHVRIWQLPFELIGAEGVQTDARLRWLLYSPLSNDYFKPNTRGQALGYNLNGLAYAALFLGGGLTLGLGAGRLRFAALALWVGFGLLSLGSSYAIPFFAIVSVPIIAAQLNAFSEKVTLRSWGDPKSRFVLLGSAAGRVICIFATIVACLLAWPGWIHPDTGAAAYARRVAWGIYSDRALIRAAEQLQDWRASGRLPDDARGVVLSTELANYCAWFAPREKVFLNSRYNHHRRELGEYIAIRKDLELIPSDHQPDRKEIADRQKRLEDTFQKYRTEYVAVYGGPGDGSLRFAAMNTSFIMWRETDHWSTWYLNGRTVISGWRRAPGEERPTFAALRMNPLVLAFGKNAERLPPGEVKPIPPQLGWEDEFIHGVTISPAGADEAIGWAQYGAVRRAVLERHQQAANLLLVGVDHVAGGSGGIFHAAMPAVLQSLHASLHGDELEAIPFLALRAARRAINTDPNHPDGYYALALALADTRLPMSDDERAVGRATALRQFLVRVPPPERFQGGSYLATPWQAAFELAAIYLGLQPGARQGARGMPINRPAFSVLLQPYSNYIVEQRGQAMLAPAHQIQQGSRVLGGPYLLPIDLAREALVLANKYLAVDATSTDETRRAGEKVIQDLLKQVDKLYEQANGRYEREKESGRIRGGMNLAEQVERALRHNLVGEAIRLLTDPTTDLPKEYGRAWLQIAMRRVALELVTGRLEDAAGDLDILPAKIDEASARPEDAAAIQANQSRGLLQILTFEKLVLEGNYSEAGSLLERYEGQLLGRNEKPRPPAEVLRFPARADVGLWRLLAGPFWIRWPELERIQHYAAHRQQLARNQGQEGEFFYRRGLLALMEGDIASAKKRFEQSTIPAIKEWELPELRNPQAEHFLELIREAEKAEKAQPAGK